MSLNEQAAAAAESRLRGNSMSVGELRGELNSLGVDTRSAIEKNDLVALYVRAKRGDPQVPTQRPAPAAAASNSRPRTVPIPKPKRQDPYLPQMPPLPKEVNWPNGIMLLVLLMYVYSNFINPASSGEGGGSVGGGGTRLPSSYPGGVRSNAYLLGEVLDVGTNGEFKAHLKQHEEDTGLPVVVDFYSQSCGPCRQIAPYYKSLAADMAGEAVFLKVDVNKNSVTSRECNVRAMPTFLFYLNGKQVHRFSGADSRQLEQASRQLAEQAKDKKSDPSAVGTFVNQEVTPESLSTFFAKHKSDAEEHLELLKQHQGKTVSLMRLLFKKYGDVPAAVGRLDQPASSDTAAGAAATPTTTPTGGGGGGGVLEGLSTEALKAELAARGSESTEGASGEDLFTPLSTAFHCPKCHLDHDHGDHHGHHGHHAHDHDHAHAHVEDVLIVGGGPAGLSAALYAARAGLNPVVVAPKEGGQLLGKGVDVENYPGIFDGSASAVTGPSIVGTMRQQVAGFGVRLVAAHVTNVTLVQQHLGKQRAASGVAGSDGARFEVTLQDSSSSDSKEVVVRCKAVVVATGAESRWLGVQGEHELRGHGVSACATCDGYLYKDESVVVVGGGDTAMEDALVLARFAKRVTIVHRKGKFDKASHALASQVLAHEKIEVVWFGEVEKFEGKPPPPQQLGSSAEVGAGGAINGVGVGLEMVRVRITNAHNTIARIPCKAAFVAIGHDPITSFLNSTRARTTRGGYLVTPEGSGGSAGGGGGGGSTMTSVPGLFAAGDAADAIYRQAITSAGSGAKAALDVERFLSAAAVAVAQ
mmetsp:Transcript_69131/g.129910  ORF Transcript_69131/g.129910 Transcript_69131/m.129910 type:complete len:811 (-) Transcript_69131:151-2583(-)